MSGLPHWRSPAAAALSLHAAGRCLVHVTKREELQAGKRDAAQLEHEHEVTLTEDPAPQAMIDDAARPLLAVATRRDLPWTLRLVDACDVNAFSIAGWRVFDQLNHR
ncbi:MAG: hypothetical protein ACREMM_07185 [Gemmatimonadales bacterium]